MTAGGAAVLDAGGTGVTVPTARVVRVRPAPPSVAERAERAARGHGSDPARDLQHELDASRAWSERTQEAAAQYGEARDEGGARAAAGLRNAVGTGWRGDDDQVHRAAFERWLRTELSGCQLTRPTRSSVTEAGRVVGAACSLGHALSSLREDIDAEMVAKRSTMALEVQEIGDGIRRALDPVNDHVPVGTVARELGRGALDLIGDLPGFDAAGSAVVKAGDKIVEVLGFVPGFGLLTAALKVIKLSYDAVASTLKRARYAEHITSSLSVIDSEALKAADWYETRDRSEALRKLVTTGAEVGAQTLTFVGLAGAGPVVKAATTLVELAARLVRLAADVLMIDRANGWITSGSMTPARLRDAPLLGLYLPHLPGCGPLELLGIVPPGWSAADHPEQAALLQREFADPRNRSLRAALDSVRPKLGGAARAAALAPLENPWRYEHARLRFILDETNRHAYAIPWVLTRDGTPVHQPRPITRVQKAEAMAGEVARASKDAAVSAVLAAPAAAWVLLQRLPGEIGATLSLAFPSTLPTLGASGSDLIETDLLGESEHPA